MDKVKKTVPAVAQTFTEEEALIDTVVNAEKESNKKKRNLKLISTEEVMDGSSKKDISTPGEGILSSSLTDRDAATG